MSSMVVGKLLRNVAYTLPNPPVPILANVLSSINRSFSFERVRFYGHDAHNTYNGKILLSIAFQLTIFKMPF